MQPNYRLKWTTDAELQAALEGTHPQGSERWEGGQGATRRIQDGVGVGVVWREPENPGSLVQPLILIVPEPDQRQLFWRISQLRGDLSPLSTWCHVIAPRYFQRLDSLTLETHLDKGLSAAWAGLAIAEAELLSETPAAKLRLPACLGTQAFAIGRACATWGSQGGRTAMERFDGLQTILRRESNNHAMARISRIRGALQSVWTALMSVTTPHSDSSENAGIVASMIALLEARRTDARQEAKRFVEPLLELVPEATELRRLQSMTPEARLGVFDQVVRELDNTSSSRSGRRNGLAYLAGYLSTIAAGGAPSLSLAEGVATHLPEVTAWAYVLIGLGEQRPWGSGFDGLGRLVVRELLRPIRFDESPTVDFSFEEAQALVDPMVADPLVHLWIKQSRFALVALLPGVNVTASLGDVPAREAKMPPGRSNRQQELAGFNHAEPNSMIPPEALTVLADALWPAISVHVEKRLQQRERDRPMGTTHTKRGSRGG